VEQRACSDYDSGDNQFLGFSFLGSEWREGMGRVEIASNIYRDEHLLLLMLAVAIGLKSHSESHSEPGDSNYGHDCRTTFRGSTGRSRRAAADFKLATLTQVISQGQRVSDLSQEPAAPSWLKGGGRSVTWVPGF
jgi:hypothetical protein